MQQPAPQPPTRLLRILAVALPALGLTTAVAMRDTGAGLAVAGLALVVVGFVALLGRGARRPGARRGAVAVLAVGGAGLFLGGTAFGAPAAPAAVRAATAAVTPVGPASTAPRTALAALDALPVKGPAPMTGYDRVGDFGIAWADVDRNGCDTRNDVLRRDLTAVAGTRCRVSSGVLHDPYTGRTIRFVRGQGTSEAVQIDHVVALADAWRTGAQRLSLARRTALANDPGNLFAVDGPTNVRKGDGDAATWLPKRKAFRCTYVAHQVAVKRAYGLWVTKAEGAAMRRVLARCPDHGLPAAGPSAATRPAAPSTGASAAPSTGSTTAAVHPGAYCADHGATGRTAAGTAMRCATSADGRDRWRRA